MTRPIHVLFAATLAGIAGCGKASTSLPDASSPDARATPDASAPIDSQTGPFCGNGVLEAGEQCDRGAANSDAVPSACSSQCTLTALIAWFDASNPNGDGSLLADGTPVARWVDLARESHASQAAELRRPIYRLNGINGQPALFFDGMDDVLFVPVNIDAVVRPEVTIAVVLQNAPGDTSSHAGVWGQDNQEWDRFMASGGSEVDHEGISDGSWFTPVEGLTAEGVPLIVVTILREDVENGSSVHVNGVAGAIFTEDHNNTGTPELSIGNLNGPPAEPAQAFDGHIAAFFVFDRALNTAERIQLEAALSARYLP